MMSKKKYYPVPPQIFNMKIGGAKQGVSMISTYPYVKAIIITKAILDPTGLVAEAHK